MYTKLDKSEANTMRILELYSELLAEGRNELIEPGASLQLDSSDIMLQKRMMQMEDEENQFETGRKVDGSKGGVINNAKLKKVEELNLTLRWLQDALHDVIGSISNLEAVKMPSMKPISHEN